MTMGRALDRLEEARRRQPEMPPEWQRASRGGEYATWLTAEELEALNAELDGVLVRHLDRLTDSTLRPAGSRLCEFVFWGVPMYLPGVEPTPSQGEDQ
jgi:hypothetical protein